MWDILEVLRRHHRRHSQRQIRKATRKSRRAIRRYIQLAKDLGWKPSVEPTEELASQILELIRPGPKEPTAGSAILEMDAPKLGRALSDTMDAWGSMLPYTTDPYLGTQHGAACEREAPRVQGSAAVDGRTAAAAVSI